MSKVNGLITFQEAARIAAKVISERPLHVYEKPEGSTTCVNYTHTITLDEADGAMVVSPKIPSCVIGHIVHQFSDLELIGACTSSDSSIPAAFNEYGVTRKAQAFFDYLQKMQDRMILPWSACFVKAFEYVSTIDVDDTVRTVPVH